MNKTLLGLVAGACLLTGCGKDPRITVDASPAFNDQTGFVKFRYQEERKDEINFFDEGFDGTLDYVIIVSPGLRTRKVTSDSSDFAQYDSLYLRIRREATDGRLKLESKK
jgi:hypothetical protein